MAPRIDLSKTAIEGFRAMLALQAYVDRSGLEQSVLALVAVRASQMNGCAYCIDMHWKDARAHGESEQRLYGLDAWRESPYYSPRERAALEWTEALTAVATGHVPDSVYESVRGQFADEDLARLSYAVVAINGWNRLVTSFRSVPGTYVAGSRPSATAAGSQPAQRH
jgi:AhpD family alkylhydroperoxidase